MSEIHVTKDGPYHVLGNLPLASAIIGTNSEAESVRWDWGCEFPHQERYWLCRCGHSANEPFCDGTHSKIGFDGTETASHKPYLEQAKTIRGPVMSLTDAERLCAFARFCDPNGQVWRLVEETNETEARRNFTRESCDCPSGRLVAWDNATGKAIEPHYEPSIGVIEDPAETCSRPAMGARRRSNQERRRLFLRGAQSRDAVPLRRIEEQAVLRWLACRDQIHRWPSRGHLDIS